MINTPADRRKNAHLEQLLEKAKDHIVTPAEIDAQRKSWVCGEMLLQYPTMTYEEASTRYEAAKSSCNLPLQHLKPIPIEAAKRIARDYGYDQVLIYARRCHDTPEPHGEHMTTYGRTREHCDVAARIGDTLKKFMGWEV